MQNVANRRLCKNVLKWRTFELTGWITGKRLKIDGYMLRCVWQALNPLFIHVTFTAIVLGAYPADSRSVGDSHPSCSSRQRLAAFYHCWLLDRWQVGHWPLSRPKWRHQVILTFLDLKFDHQSWSFCGRKVNFTAVISRLVDKRSISSTLKTSIDSIALNN